MKVTFDRRIQTAKNIYTFWFTPEKTMRHIAGQFIELRIPHPDKDKRGDKRWFTLSSSPTDKQVSITTKFSPQNSSSFKQALDSLTPGDQLDIASPMGDFILPKDPNIPLLFVAGGIGSTPFHSIIKYLNDSGEKRDVTLIYAVSNDDEIAFNEEFSKLGDSFKKVVGSRIDADTIKTLGNVTDDHYIYLSGPEPMVEALEKDLKSGGFNKKHIYTDFFPGYTEI